MQIILLQKYQKLDLVLSNNKFYTNDRQQMGGENPY